MWGKQKKSLKLGEVGHDVSGKESWTDQNETDTNKAYNTHRAHTEVLNMIIEIIAQSKRTYHLISGARTMAT